MTLQPGTEAWMPNGFPPPSFVVEVERVSTFTTARGRWLAAAALLGAILLVAGILAIARGGNDNTAIKTGPGTTAPFDGAATVPPSTALDPTATGVEATTGPTLPLDPNASVTAPGGGPGTTAAGGPGPSGPSGPPPPPGVLQAPASVTLTTAFTDPARSGTGAVDLKNTGAGSLNFTSRQSPGLSIAPGSGTIAAGGTVNVTVSLDGKDFPEGDYKGSVIFEGSGGAKTVNISSKVAKPPTISPGGDTQDSFVDVDPPNTICKPGWRVRALVQDASRLASVTVTVTLNGTAGSPFGMTRQSGDERSGYWILGNQAGLPSGTSRVKFSIRAVDELGAEKVAPATATEESFSCP